MCPFQRCHGSIVIYGVKLCPRKVRGFRAFDVSGLARGLQIVDGVCWLFSKVRTQIVTLMETRALAMNHCFAPEKSVVDFVVVVERA